MDLGENELFLPLGVHLRVLRGSKAAACQTSPLAALKTAIRRAEDEVHLYEEEHIRAPGENSHSVNVWYSAVQVMG